MKTGQTKPHISKIKSSNIHFPRWQVKGRIFDYDIYGVGDTIESAWYDYREILKYELEEAEGLHK